jgi:hypothetical protein
MCRFYLEPETLALWSGRRDFRVGASEWGEPALILGGTPENSVAGRSRK